MMKIKQNRINHLTNRSVEQLDIGNLAVALIFQHYWQPNFSLKIHNNVTRLHKRYILNKFNVECHIENSLRTKTGSHLGIIFFYLHLTTAVKYIVPETVLLEDIIQKKITRRMRKFT